MTDARTLETIIPCEMACVQTLIEMTKFNRPKRNLLW